MELLQIPAHRLLYLCACFAVYVVTIAIFGFIYLKLHRMRGVKHFAFGSSIQVAQFEAMRSDLKQKIKESEIQAGILSELTSLSQRVAGGADDIGRGSEIILSSGARAIFGANYVPGTGPDQQGGYDEPQLTLFDKSNEVVGKKSTGGTFSAANYRELVNLYSKQVNELLVADREHLTAVTESSPEIWTLRDFIYFSAIAQTTVGFGDILPNSGTVRQIVVSQILLGYFFFVVILNIILATQ